MVENTDILGVRIFKGNLRETLELFTHWIETKQKRRVCVLPVNCILWATANESLKELYNTSDLNVADGVPVVWASRFLNNPIKGRVTGLDILPAFAEIAYKKNFTFFLLGAKEGVAEELAAKLNQDHPGIRILGVYSPPFAERFSDEENRKMVDMINAVKPNVLWVSLTAPKQDKWINEFIGQLDVNIAIGVGGAFEVTAGLIKRAPKWMQKNGLEWLFRFSQEPKRLFKRYFVEAPVFVPMVIRQKFKNLFKTPENRKL